MNAVSQTVHKNNTSAGDTIPVVSAHVTTDHSLQGTITGIPATFLVDTGAAASILSKQVWDKVSKQQEASLEVVPGRNLIGVEGSALKIHGAVHLQVIFERQQFNVCFLVADSLTTEAILGRDFLKDNSCIIDAKQKHLGCKKSVRPIRSHNGYKRPKTLISSKAKKLNILLRILSLE